MIGLDSAQAQGARHDGHGGDASGNSNRPCGPRRRACRRAAVRREPIPVGAQGDRPVPPMPVGDRPAGRAGGADSGRGSGCVRAGRCRRTEGMERRVRRLRPSADAGAAPSATPPPTSNPASKGCGRWPPSGSISRASFDKYVRGLTPDLRIMDLLDAQPEFTKAFWDYLDILVSDARIQTGRELLAKHKAIFDKVEKAYGVDRHIITAIWGVEFELQHARRRSPGAALDRDARLRRPPPGLFPRRVSLRAGNPASRRSAAGAAEGLVGRRVRADAVHADVVQALRRRFRRRRPPRRGRLRSPI